MRILLLITFANFFEKDSHSFRLIILTSDQLFTLSYLLQFLVRRAVFRFRWMLIDSVHFLLAAMLFNWKFPKFCQFFVLFLYSILLFEVCSTPPLLIRLRKFLTDNIRISIDQFPSLRFYQHCSANMC